ncbi:MAG: hypothetical protein IPK26_17330 [Planctomycetes bacterium]|nr:hypothetical protein [Planctomycetota bacterium]
MIAGVSAAWIVAVAPQDPAVDFRPCGGIDGLGRVLPDAAQCPSPRPDRHVLLFYFVWHGAHGHDDHRQPPPGGGVWPKEARDYKSPYDLSVILADRSAGAPHFGPPHAFHWWAQPHLGYYLADDTAVLRRHALWLANAGVDAIAIDVTNGLTYASNCARLLTVWDELRRTGVRVPQVTFLAHAEARAVTDALWREVYGPRHHEAMWFRWRGKPLLLAPADEVDPEHREFFALRRSWAWSAGAWFGDGKDAWPWLDHHPQRFGWHDGKDHREALAVAVAQHPTTNIGRSFHAGRQPAPGDERTAEGLCFQEQWDHALAVDPELVFVTGWNEWSAMRFLSDGLAPMCGRTLPPGDSYFVDAYSPEFSRDLEPMRGGHEDAYYWQLVANIRRYKGVPRPSEPSPPRTIALDADASVWRDVTPKFADHPGDTFGRDHPGQGRAGPYRQDAAPNDLLLAQVAHDATDVLFRIEATAALELPPARDDALRLLIDTDDDPRTGWCGFDLLIGGNGHRDDTTTVARIGPLWTDRETRAEVHTHRVGPAMVIRLPRALLGQGTGPLVFAFQWTAAVGDDGHRIDWLDHGDAAPDGRFTFRYRGQ